MYRLGLKVQSDAEKAEIKANYEEIWKQAKSSAVAFGFEESTVSAVAVSKEEQERVFEEAWNTGGGFRFMFGTFGDIATNPEANEAAANFIRKKIQEIVKDPETARKLTPTGLYAKRPLCDNGYYDTLQQRQCLTCLCKGKPDCGNYTKRCAHDGWRVRIGCVDLCYWIRCGRWELYEDRYARTRWYHNERKVGRWTNWVSWHDEYPFSKSCS